MASVFVHTTMKGTPIFFSSRPRGSTVTCLLSIVLSAAESSSADVLCESYHQTMTTCTRERTRWAKSAFTFCSASGFPFVNVFTILIITSIH